MSCFPACDTPQAQNRNRWVLLGLTLLAWIFSIVSVGSCSFVGSGYYNVGIFSTQGVYSGSCVSYGGGGDSGVQAGRAFGTLACLSLTFALIGISLVIFVLRDKRAQMVWLGTKILYSFALLCVVLTFTFVGADFCKLTHCKLKGAGVITVFNTFIMTGVVAVCWCVPLPSAPMCGGGDDGCGTCGGCGGCGGGDPTPDEAGVLPAQILHPNQKEAPRAPMPVHGEETERIEEITPEGQCKVTKIIDRGSGTKTSTETMKENVVREDEENVRAPSAPIDWPDALQVAPVAAEVKPHTTTHTSRRKASKTPPVTNLARKKRGAEPPAG